MPPTLNRTFTKLLTYSIAMVAVPFAAYKLAGDVVLAGMEDAGQRTTYAGVAAVVGVNAVLVSYVGSALWEDCLLYTSPSPRDRTRSRMPSSA